MSRVVEALLTAKRREQEDLMRSVFANPPANMEQFNFRRGQWQEMENTIQDLLKLSKGEEDI